MKRSLRSYEEPPKDIAELWERIQDTWAGIDRDIMKKLVECMPRCITNVLKCKGPWSNYEKVKKKNFIFLK